MPFGAPQFATQGPHIHDGQTAGANAVMDDHPVSGGVEVVVPHPTNADVLWVGTVNGGIWKATGIAAINTNNLGLTVWVPLLDLGPSMSISALELDPTDTTYSTLVAGVGRTSAFGEPPNYDNFGSERTGLLRSTDGGLTWTQLGTKELSGLDVRGIAARGHVIVIATTHAGGGTNGGIWRSTDTGASFTRLSGDTRLYGLPAGDAFDLEGNPFDDEGSFGDVRRLYAAIAFTTGANGGVYRSDDLGATWVALGGPSFGGAGTTAPPAGTQPTGIVATTSKVELAVYNNTNPVAHAVYAGVLNAFVANPNRFGLAGLFRLDTATGIWTSIPAPVTPDGEGGGLHPDRPSSRPGGQGRTHFSIVADPTNPNLVYIGGDRQPDPAVGLIGPGNPNSVGATGYTGRLFRCTTAGACAAITDNNTANHSGPHADSRDMAFARNGHLYEGDDGGIFKQTSPHTNGGDWFSINGEVAGAPEPLAVTEFHSCAYDSLSDMIICGTQDVGTVEQIAVDGRTWRTVNLGDGGFVAVFDGTGGAGNLSLRYSSAFNLGGFRYRDCDAAGALWRRPEQRRRHHRGRADPRVLPDAPARRRRHPDERGREPPLLLAARGASDQPHADRDRRRHGDVRVGEPGSDADRGRHGYAGDARCERDRLRRHRKRRRAPVRRSERQPVRANGGRRHQRSLHRRLADRERHRGRRRARPGRLAPRVRGRPGPCLHHRRPEPRRRRALHRHHGQPDDARPAHDLQHRVRPGHRVRDDPRRYRRRRLPHRYAGARHLARLRDDPAEHARLRHGVRRHVGRADRRRGRSRRLEAQRRRHGAQLPVRAGDAADLRRVTRRPAVRDPAAARHDVPDRAPGRNDPGRRRYARRGADGPDRRHLRQVHALVRRERQ